MQKHVAEIGWNEQNIACRQKSFCPDGKVKVPPWYRGCSDWRELTHNISIPLKCAPSNFRRDWIKSLSAVEVRQRLVWGSKTLTSGQLASSEPGEQTWLSPRSSARLSSPGHYTERNKTTGRDGECITCMKLLHRHLYIFVFLITSDVWTLADYFSFCVYSRMKKK